MFGIKKEVKYPLLQETIMKDNGNLKRNTDTELLIGLLLMKNIMVIGKITNNQVTVCIFG